MQSLSPCARTADVKHFRLRLLLTTFLCAMCAFMGTVQAQHPGDPGPYSGGYADFTEQYTGLNNPQITFRLYYPATAAGSQQPVASGVFPAIAFGHGFNLNYQDYENLCLHLASWGFVVASPDVQNGFNVDHEEYAKELAACVDILQLFAADPTSDFYQKVDSMTGVYGHSMGGGASGLVPSVFPGIDAVSGLAAAETNPSAIAALANYSGPFQTISGSDDNTAPESSNQIPMYNAPTGDKHWVSITGGAHCKFTDGTTICDLVSSPGSISRSDQQAIANVYTTAFFAYYLQNDLSMLPWLCGDSLRADSSAGTLTFETNINCVVTGLEAELASPEWTLYPNPATEQIVITTQESIVVYSALGAHMPLLFTQTPDGIVLDLKGWAPGFYWVRSTTSGAVHTLLKQ